MSRPVPQPVRTVLALSRVAVRLGLMPSNEKSIAAPHEVRLGRTLPARTTGTPDLTVRTWDHAVPARGGDVPTRVYARPNVVAGAPVVLFLHGGGFVNFGLEVSDTLCRALAARTGYVVVSPSYRLAPEHPFPAALEDGEDVLAWIADARPCEADVMRLAVAGESAGANLAIALCLATRDRGGPAIAQLTAIHPPTDTALTSPDWDAGAIPGMDRVTAEQMYGAYAPDQRTHPYVDVLHADLVGLPPAMVISCEHDPIRSDAIWFAEALQAAGVPTTHRHYDNMPHGYLLLRGVLKEADVSLGHIVDALREHLEAPVRQ